MDVDYDTKKTGIYFRNFSKARITESKATVFIFEKQLSLFLKCNMENNNILSWDEYFMSFAIVASMRSKDPNTKVGACLVDENNHIVGTGYNSFPKGIDDSQMPLAREGNWLSTKYPFIVHAELNCILNSTIASLKNTRLFCTLFPCNECAKCIVQSGIKEVIYLSNKHKNCDIYIASQKILELSNIKIRQFKNINFDNIIKMFSISLSDLS